MLRKTLVCVNCEIVYNSHTNVVLIVLMRAHGTHGTTQLSVACWVPHAVECGCYRQGRVLAAGAPHHCLCGQRDTAALIDWRAC